MISPANQPTQIPANIQIPTAVEIQRRQTAQSNANGNLRSVTLSQIAMHATETDWSNLINLNISPDGVKKLS